MTRARGDRALIGITDAFLTLLILSIASFALMKASFASTEAADATSRTFFIEQVRDLNSALQRSTVKSTMFFAGTAEAAPRNNERVSSLVGEIHYFMIRGNKPAAGVQGVADAILDNADALSNGRWVVAIEVVDPSATDPAAATVCIFKPVRAQSCSSIPEMPPLRYTSSIQIPKPSSMGQHLDATLYAFTPLSGGR